MTKPVVTEQDIQAARDMLERTRAQHSPEEHATLVEMVEILAEVRAQVSEYDGDGDDDDPLVGEQLLVRAIERVRARLRKPT